MQTKPNPQPTESNPTEVKICKEDPMILHLTNPPFNVSKGSESIGGGVRAVVFAGIAWADPAEDPPGPETNTKRVPSQGKPNYEWSLTFLVMTLLWRLRLWCGGPRSPQRNNGRSTERVQVRNSLTCPDQKGME
eukprot:882579-Amphidinium_carterae.1